MSQSEAARAHATLRAHPRVHWQSPAAGRAARRIVSLVPSLSEALFVLGLGDRLVGVTEYCVHPAGAFASLPKLGGTKDADVLAIAALAPDLVIANQEENTPRVVRQLADRGIDVWVTYPRTVREGIELLAELAALGASPERSAAVVAPARDAFEQVEAATGGLPDSERPRVFCPIWRDPWMTIGRDTYIHDMIALCGGENVFAGPAPRADQAGSGAGVRAEGGNAARAESASAEDARLASDRRYPIVGLDEVERAQPDIILLPDEPYAFSESDRAELGGLDCEAARRDRIHLIDGTLVSWYGSRIAQAIRVLAGIFAAS